ncbi:class I SAM-dependent methyltransferase [Edaphobacter modestus]|uniref:Methyltransferase family protein n=1 Tax=Edaphobacter modestus TaxID=388466 RepID=A0A4Q7YYP9_9BACT|nr:class I SAM-dependent methyltransferase [Edaphobacter modestus]RZU42269.1 methyltransferase family protein [Edaphobacter modestus]
MTPDLEALKSAETFWNVAADTYEQKFSGTIVGQIRRRVTWRELERAFKPGESVLELNCGTGIDAVYLGTRNISVTAFDLSPKMIALARDHAKAINPISHPRFEVLATENLDTLEVGPFDGAFSNFSGLNCVDNLGDVSRDVARLLRPQGRFLICMMGRFVPVEIIWFLLHGKPRRAFSRMLPRRLSGDGPLVIQRPTVHHIALQMRTHFRLVQWRGAGITVPPSYAEKMAIRIPRIMAILAVLDQRVGHLPLIRSMADCVILEFEKI